MKRDWLQKGSQKEWLKSLDKLKSLADRPKLRSKLAWLRPNASQTR